jgi:hypothetical protein
MRFEASDMPLAKRGRTLSRDRRFRLSEMSDELSSGEAAEGEHHTTSKSESRANEGKS